MNCFRSVLEEEFFSGFFEWYTSHVFTLFAAIQGCKKYDWEKIYVNDEAIALVE